MQKSSGRHPAGTAGYTLLEMLLSLVLVALVGSMFLNAPRPVPERLAGDTARRIRGAVAAVLAEAGRDGQDAELRVDATPEDGRRGRFRVVAVDSGSAAPAGAEWLELTDGVLWHDAGMGRDPLGAASDGTVPGTLRCTPAACETGAADHVAYFVGHVRAPRVGYAIVLTRGREVLLYRWDAPSGAWTGETQ